MLLNAPSSGVVLGGEIPGLTLQPVSSKTHGLPTASAASARSSRKSLPKVCTTLLGKPQLDGSAGASGLSVLA